MTHYVYRPIDRWPGELTSSNKRKPIPFRSKFEDTIGLLGYEIGQLGASEAVIQIALLEGEIRLDGLPRANSRPSHPGVIVAFETKRLGPLQFATDVFEARWSGEEGWHANLRAVALGLEALRKVDRYGITRRGEQYTGWKALPPSSIELGQGEMSVEEAARFIAAHGGGGPHDERHVIDDPLRRLAVYRVAAKQLHPDAGGDEALFKRLQEAKAVLEAFG